MARQMNRRTFLGSSAAVLRMWMPYDNGFLVLQPHVRNAAALAIRRTDAYGSPTIARVWLDK